MQPYWLSSNSTIWWYVDKKWLLFLCLWRCHPILCMLHLQCLACWVPEYWIHLQMCWASWHMDNPMIGCYHMPEEPSLIPIGNPKMFAIGTVPVCNALTSLHIGTNKLQPQESLCCFSSGNQAKTDSVQIINQNEYNLHCKKARMECKVHSSHCKYAQIMSNLNWPPSSFFSGKK